MYNTDNSRLVDKLITITYLEKTTLNYKNGQYLPVLKQGNIVQCQFTGIGSEYDLVHFAIVWLARSNNETILIIPLTSQNLGEDKDQFFLGTISNFVTDDSFIPKDSYVYLNKISEVSRRRIKLWNQIDSTGNKVLIGTYPVTVEINKTQMDRIKEGIRATFLGEKVLFDIIMENINKDLIIDSTKANPTTLLHGYRIIEWFNKVSDVELQYKLLDGSSFSIIFRIYNKKKILDQTLFTKINYSKNAINNRNEIMRSMFSNISELVIEGQDILKNIDF